MRFSSIVTAMERIQHRHKTELDRDLVTICEDALTHIKNTRVLNKDGTPQKADKVRQFKIHNYLQKEIAPRIDAALKKHQGMKCKTTVYNSPEINAAMHFDIPGLNLIRVFGHASDNPSGKAEPEDSMWDEERELYDLLNKSVDPTTGVINPAAYAHINYYMHLTLGPFMCSEVYNTDIEFTATEIAAIWLHEIGHMVTLTQFLSRTYYQATDLADALKLFTNRVEPMTAEQLEERLDIVRSMVAKYHKNYLPTYDTMTAKIRALLTKTKEDKSGAAPTLLIGILLQTAAAYVLIIIGFIALMLGASIIASWCSMITDKPIESLFNNYNRRTSETTFSTRNASVTEREADNFVTAHGRAGDLASALYKLYHASSTSRISYRALGSNPVTYAISLVLDLVYKLLPPVTPYTNPYDTALVRFKQIIENSTVALKSADIPKEMRDQYIVQTEAAMAVYKEATSKSWANKRGLITEKLLKLSSAKSHVAGIVNANLQADYEVLQNITGGYIRNPLYLRAAILDQLHDKNKKA